MSIYAIADLHLSFSAEKSMDIFGGQWVNHTERIEENWRTIVKEEDTVIVPGDISWAMKLSDAVVDLDWIDALPGKKVLIKGNHDLWWNSITKLNRMYDSIHFLQNNYVKAEGWAICGTRGWIGPWDMGFMAEDEKVYKRELLRLRMSLEAAVSSGEKHIIGVIHFPPLADNGGESGFAKLFKEYGVEYVVYGHLHGYDAHQRALQGVYGGTDYRLVACDYLKCSPLLIYSNES